MPTTTAQSAQRLRVICAGICALVLSVGLARFGYTPLLPVMRAQAGLSDLAAGWLATVNYAGYMAGALLASTLGQLRHKYLGYRIGLLAALLSTLGMGLTDNLALWAGLRFIAGLSSTAGMLLASGLVLNWLIREGFNPLLGLHFMGLGLGIAVSGLAIAAMPATLDWAAQWLGLGLLGALFFLPAWHWMPAPAALDAAGGPSLPGAPAPGRRWLALLTAAYFCGGFGFVVSATFIIAVLVKLPLLSGWGSAVWALVGLAATPSCFIWDRIAARLGPIEALMLAYALQSLSTILPVLSDDPLLNIAGAMLFGATFVGIVSLTLTLVGRQFPANPAKAMARMTLSYGVAQVCAPALAGYIASLTGSYRGALLLTFVVMLAGIGLLQAMRSLPATSRP